MIGAIAGDSIGSICKWNSVKSIDVCLLIASGVAEAFYGGVPPDIRDRALETLGPDLQTTTERFLQQYGLDAA